MYHAALVNDVRLHPAVTRYDTHLTGYDRHSPSRPERSYAASRGTAIFGFVPVLLVDCGISVMGGFFGLAACYTF